MAISNTTYFNTNCGNVISLNEETIKHLQAHPEAEALLEEAIAKIDLPREGGFLMTTVEFDRVIGTNACVKANEENLEKIFFSVRPGRELPTRVLIGQKPEPTNLFTILASKNGKQWNLVTGFTGPQAPREPHAPYFAEARDGRGQSEAKAFWTEHGLCLGDDWGKPFVSNWPKVIIDAAWDRCGW